MPRTKKEDRPKLPPVSEGMRRTFALLAEELAGWPGVSTKLMFGFRAVYREGVVFAMLPDKRSLEVLDAIAYKEGSKWVSFEMKGEDGIGGALRVLRAAYEEGRSGTYPTGSSDNRG
jgi:hypothetical protein